MKTSFIKKASALACSAVTLAAVSIAAISASAAGSNAITAEEVTVKATDKKIPYTVKLVGENTFDCVNFTLQYDTRLTPYMEMDVDDDGNEVPSKNIPENESDDYKGMAQVNINPSKGVIGYGIALSKAAKENADLNLTKLYFDLPADAKPGDKYEFTFLEANSKVLLKENPLEVTNVKGYILVEGETTETTTETTTTETTTETTTTEATTSEVTTSEVTTSETSSVSETTATTASSTDAGTGSSTTKATQAATTKATQAATTKATNGGNGGKQDGPTTGDAGVALALTGLLAAAGTAVVARKKH